MDAARNIGKVITSIIAGVSFKIGLPGALEFSFEANKALAKAAEVAAADQSSTTAAAQVTARSDPQFPQSVYHACFRTLQETFARFSRDTKEVRIVVFVDDLDRCLPQGALDVLEAIRRFFDLDGFIFVVGLERGIDERFVESRYSAVPAMNAPRLHCAVLRTAGRRVATRPCITTALRGRLQRGPSDGALDPYPCLVARWALATRSRSTLSG
jgi:hypothetical protein